MSLRAKDSKDVRGAYKERQKALCKACVSVALNSAIGLCPQRKTTARERTRAMRNRGRRQRATALPLAVNATPGEITGADGKHDRGGRMRRRRRRPRVKRNANSTNDGVALLVRSSCRKQGSVPESPLKVTRSQRRNRTRFSLQRRSVFP